MQGSIVDIKIDVDLSLGAECLVCILAQLESKSTIKKSPQKVLQNARLL